MYFRYWFKNNVCLSQLNDTVNAQSPFHSKAFYRWRSFEMKKIISFHALASARAESRDEWRTLNGGTRGFEKAVRAFENAVRRNLENADGRAFDRVGMNGCGGSRALPEKTVDQRSWGGTASINLPKVLSR